MLGAMYDVIDTHVENIIRRSSGPSGKREGGSSRGHTSVFERDLCAVVGQHNLVVVIAHEMWLRFFFGEVLML